MLVALSLGMRRIVSFVAALSLAPPLLVVDEVTAALDPEAVIVVREALRAAASHGTEVLLATQDLHFAECSCDEVILLSAGRTIAAMVGMVATNLTREARTCARWLPLRRSSTEKRFGRLSNNSGYWTSYEVVPPSFWQRQVSRRAFWVIAGWTMVLV